MECRIPILSQEAYSEASKSSPDLEPLKLRSARSPLSLVAAMVDWDAAASDGSKGDGMHAGILDVSAALASMPRSPYK